MGFNILIYCDVRSTEHFNILIYCDARSTEHFNILIYCDGRSIEYFSMLIYCDGGSENITLYWYNVMNGEKIKFTVLIYYKGR
jgi:hypothetical protein